MKLMTFYLICDINIYKNTSRKKNLIVNNELEYWLTLEICSVSTNGERASPAPQGFQLMGYHFSYKNW